MIPSLHGGGAEFASRQWINELAARGHRVTVYLYDRHQPSVSIPGGVSVQRFRLHWPVIRRLLLALWLRRTILATRPTAVIAMLTYSNVATLVAALGKGRQFPRVFISERTIRGLPMSHERRRDRAVLWLGRRLYRSAAGGLAISHPVALDMVTTFKMRPEQIAVIPNPVVSGERESRAPRARASSRPLHLAFVGRLVEEKRPQLFVELVGELSRQGRAVHGTIIGDGHLRAELEALVAREAMKVAFAGWREPWWSAVDDIDCVVVTSYREGFANVLVEAARARIPCVAGGQALGVADALLPGITGELAIPDHVADYAAAVIRATTTAPPSAETLDRWLAHFSVDHSVDCLLRAIAPANAGFRTTSDASVE